MVLTLIKMTFFARGGQNVSFQWFWSSGYHTRSFSQGFGAPGSKIIFLYVLELRVSKTLVLFWCWSSRCPKHSFSLGPVTPGINMYVFFSLWISGRYKIEFSFGFGARGVTHVSFLQGLELR